MSPIKQLTREEAEALMADIGYSKHSDCRELVETAFGLGVSRTMAALKPGIVALKTGNVKLDEAWAKVEKLERGAALKQVYEWTKTDHINLVEFNVLIQRVMAQ